jgi:SAM-dependent methyltransferase
MRRAPYDCPVETGSETSETDTAAEADWQRRGSSFGTVAAQYAQHRPGYADAAIRWCLAPVSRAQPLRVADLGAGTGILTAALARLGAEVIAVEPDQAMLAELRRQLPGVQAVEGRAEALPLPDGSLDAVLCGQAMHWFDLDRALPEIGRVLTPGGVLAGLWNVDDDRVGWVAELAAIIGSETRLSRWRADPPAQSEQGVLRAGSRWFAPVEEGEFSNGQQRSADSLAAAMTTHSRVLVMDEAERARTVTAIRDCLRRHPETSADEFTQPLITVTLRATRRAGDAQFVASGRPEGPQPGADELPRRVAALLI